MKNLRAFLFMVVLILSAGATIAQEKPQYKIEGNEVVKIETEKKRSDAVKTGLIHKIKETSYPVYKSAKGAYFIIRTSKKTGKEYKQYLKITE